MTLQQLRSRVTGVDRDILNRCWSHYRVEGRHVPVREIYFEFGRPRVEESVQRLTGNLIRETWGGTGQVYGLSFLGALVSSDGERLENLLERYLAAVKKAYEANHRIKILSRDDMNQYAAFSPSELLDLGRLLSLGIRFVDTSASSPSADGNWYVNIGDKIDDIRRITDFQSFIKQGVMTAFDPTEPVSDIERANRALKDQRQFFNGLESGSQAKASPPTSVNSTSRNITALAQAWAALRAALENNFRFYDIKEIVGLAGLDITELAHLEQKSGGGASKGQLMTGIDRAFRELNYESRQRFVAIVSEEVLKRRSDTQELLSQHLSRLGLVLTEGAIIPLQLYDPQELAEIPAEPRGDLIKAAQRFRDGDLSGAISAACGAVDNATARIYAEANLGDPGDASFQERCKKALAARGVMPALEEQLSQVGWQVSDVTLFKRNFEGALIQGAYVMQSLRSKMGDVHGTKPILKPLVFDCMKWAELVVRALTEP